jgi:uncharacterized protein YggE
MRSSTHVATFLVLFFAAGASADDRRTISVTGHGEIEVEPDVATVRMGIFVFDRDLLKSKREADKITSNILSALKDLEVKMDDIQSSQLHVKPKYRDRNDTWEFVGYEITRSVTVNVRKLMQLNDVLNKSIEAGANRLENTSLSYSKELEVKEQTLTRAIDDAKRRASRLADGFGAKVGKVVTIEAERASGGDVRYNLLFAPEFGDATYHPGRITIETSVSVVLELTD